MARILALGCHPDDVEFMCAGTLFLLSQKRHTLHVATMCVGDCGTAEYTQLDITAIRLAEARRAAKMLKAQFHCAMVGDVMLEDSNEHRAKAVAIMRRANPDIVMTMPPNDYMVDHEVTSRLARNACFLSSLPNYAYAEAVTEKPTKRVPALFYTDAQGGKDIMGNRIQPHFYVDITSTIDMKARMLSCHASQRNWLRRQHGVDEYLNAMKRHAAERGKEAGVKYAEAFLQHRGHAYPEQNVLKSLLGEKVIEAA